MHKRATFQRIARSLVGVACGLMLALPFASPVRADTAGQRSTRNIILGAAAATAAVILYNNYHHKQVAHDTIVGYTRDGGTVYADGRIVYPNGTVVYANQNGAPCSWDGSQAYCGNTAYYYPRNGGGDADDQGNYDANYANGPYGPNDGNGPYYGNYGNNGNCSHPNKNRAYYRYGNPNYNPNYNQNHPNYNQNRNSNGNGNYYTAYDGNQWNQGRHRGDGNGRGRDH